MRHHHPRYRDGPLICPARLIFEQVPEQYTRRPTPEIKSPSCREQLDDLAFQTMQQLAQTGSMRFFDAINNQFLCHPQAEQVLIAAAVQDPQSMARYIGRYAHAPYLMQIVRKITPELDTGFVKAMLRTPNLPADVATFLSKQLKAKQEREALLADQLMPQSDSLHRDRRLADWSEYQPEWFDTWTQKFGETPVVKLRAIITRNLYAFGTPPSEQAVDTAAKNLIEQREAVRDLNLFRGRNVILAANSEQWSPAGNDRLENRFGPPAVQKSIANQGGKLQLVRGADQTDQNTTYAILEKIKSNLLKKIRTTPPPFTFMFDGHGSNVLSLTDDIAHRDLYNRVSGVTELTDGKITAEELAAAFIDRQKNFPELAKGSTQQSDIIVFSSCFSHSFTVRLYELLASKGATPPIIAGMAEFGQYGFSQPSSKFGSEFAENTLGLKNGSSTLGTIMRQSNNQKTSSPFIYVPYRKKPMQIL